MTRTVLKIYIYRAFLGSAYISKTNKIYSGPNSGIPSWVTRFYSDNGVIRGDGSNYTAVSDSSDGSIFSKPIKKALIDAYASFVLTEDNELYTMGANMALTANRYSRANVAVCGLPYKVNDPDQTLRSTSGMTKIPGNWIDFGFQHTIFESQLYALSTNGELYTSYATTGQKMNNLASHTLYPNFMGDTPPEIVITTDNFTMSASYDLTRTKIPITLAGNNILFKKIFSGKDNHGDLGYGYLPLLLQTQDDKIVVIQKNLGYSFDNAETGYVKYNGQDIVVEDENIHILKNANSSSAVLLVSGGKTYGMGNVYSNSKARNWVETLGNGLNYDIQNLLPYDTYLNALQWDNFPPNDHKNIGGAVGYLTYSSGNPNSGNFLGNDGYTLIYTDGIGLSGLGYGPSGIWNIYSPPQPDEVIMKSVNRNINVGGFTDTVSLPFTENLEIALKNSNGAPTAGGDSGTAIFACLSSTVPSLSTFKLVGLIYAGPSPSYSSSGYGVRIDNIQNELDIEPWDGII